MDLSNITNVEFSYYDENSYVYNFYKVQNKDELISSNELRVYMLCKETNTSANGEVFLDLKKNQNNLYFKTDYFANSFEYIKIQEKSKTNKKEVYEINFGKDLLEISLYY